MVSWGELFSTFLVRKIMRVEGTCRSANGGGWSLFVGSPYIRHPLLSSGLSLSCLSSGQKASETGQKGQKLHFLWCALVFSRCFARPKGAKFKYIFESEGKKTGGGGRLPAFWRVHWSRGGRAFETQDLPEVGSGPLVACSLISSAFLLCPRCVACKYGSISHFKGVFRGFPLLDVGLYCFDALRGLWGFCVREWLGGFMA